MDDEAPSRILFLDDDFSRAARFLAAHPDAVWVQTADECIRRLTDRWTVVHLDHDLGGEIFVDSSRTDCGMEVVRWLAGGQAGAHLKDALFVVHTHNMNAAGVMVRMLREAGYETLYRPFGIDLLSWLEEPDPAVPPPQEYRTSVVERLRRFVSGIPWRRGADRSADLATRLPRPVPGRASRRLIPNAEVAGIPPAGASLS